MAWDRPKKFNPHRNKPVELKNFLQIPFYQAKKQKALLDTKQIDFTKLTFEERLKIIINNKPKEFIPKKSEIRMKGLYLHRKPKKVVKGISVEEELFITIKIDELKDFLERVGDLFEFADPVRGRLFLVKAYGYRQKSGHLRFQNYLIDWATAIDNSYRKDIVSLPDLSDIMDMEFDEEGKLKKS
jgi:hypothetical protein